MPSSSAATTESPQAARYQVDDLIVDVGRRSVSRAGTEIALPGLSFDLLLALVKAAPNMLSYDELMAQVWSGLVVNSETVSQRVKLVRDALGDDPHAPRYIAGVRGRGYRMLAGASLLAQPVSNLPADTSPAAANPSPTRFRSTAIALAAILLASAGLAWIVIRTSTNSGRTSAAEVVVTVPRSIAVLPFVDMSEDKSQEYFADGMAEELLGVLARIPQLSVIGRTSSFSFKGRNEKPSVIGSQLGAAHLVVGSVRRSGNRVRVSAQLIEARSGAQLWSNNYDGELGDVLVLQNRIATAIARALQLAVGTDALGDNRHLDNPEAYALVLRGRAVLDRGDNSLIEAKHYFEQALALEPAFAKAQEALAFALFAEVQYGLVLPEIGWPMAIDAARETLQLDPKSVLARVILGMERAEYAYDWRGANEELEHVLGLQSRDPFALFASSWLAASVGRFDDATRLLDAAVALDPLNPEARQSRGELREYQGNLDEAEREYRTCLSISPSFAYIHRALGVLMLMRGRPEEALKEMEAETGGKDMGLALAYHALGRKAESDAALARYKAVAARNPVHTYVSAARVHAFRGELDQAFEMLEKAYERRDHNLGAIRGDWLFESLRSDPRYADLLRRMNWPYEPAKPAAATK